MSPNPLPLLDKTILVTRPADQASELQRPLEALGARALLQPATQILPSSRPEALDAALTSLNASNFDWLLFSSANGVRFTLERLCELYHLDANQCGSFLQHRGARTCVVGSGTAKALEKYGVAPAVVPDKFDAEGLVAALDKVVVDYPSQRFLSLRASRGRQVLSQALTERGAQWQAVEAYKSVAVTTPSAETLDALQKGAIDAAVATSSASAKALVAMFREEIHKTRWIAISELTADAMNQLGVAVEKIAKESTMSALVDAVLELLAQ